MAFEWIGDIAGRLGSLIESTEGRTLCWIRMRSNTAGDKHSYAGFRTYGLSQDDLQSPEYRAVFRQVSEYFKWHLRAGVALDTIPDYVLPVAGRIKNRLDGAVNALENSGIEIPKEQLGYFGKALDELADLGPMYAATVAERNFCRENEFNFFDNSSSARRFAQMTAGGAMEHLDKIAEWFNIDPKNTPWYARPLFNYLPLIPVNALFTAGIIFERADEQYFNRGYKARGGIKIRTSELSCEPVARADPNLIAEKQAAASRPVSDEERGDMNVAYYDVYGMTHQQFMDFYNDFVANNPTVDPEELFRRRAA